MQKFQKFFLALTLLAFSGSLAFTAEKSSKPSSSKPAASKPTPAPSKPPASRPSTPPPAQKPAPKVEEKKTPPPVVETKKPASRPNQTVTEKAKTDETIRKNEESKKPVQFIPPVVETKKPASRPNQTVTEKTKTDETINNSVKPVVVPVQTPSQTNTVQTPTSTKPTNVKFDSAANNARQQEESAKKFKASTTPKSEYKTPTGQTVAINSNDAGVKTIRQNLDPERYATRSTRVEHHYHNYYGDRYGYYRTQPYVYVGGGYDSIFWYAMMDWSLERRAMWMYNHQNTINQQLYAQQMADNAQLRAEVEALKLRGQAVNPHYVDPEFTADPDVMYSEDYVNAAYNPEPEPVVSTPPVGRGIVHEQRVLVQSSGMGWILLYVFGGLGLTALFVYIVFIHDWKV